MLRRHFFLFGALALLFLMVVAGGFKLLAGNSGRAGAQVPAAGGASVPASGPGGAGPRRPATPVSVAVAAARPFVDAIEVLGVARGRQSVTLTAATTQLVRRVLFTDGQNVARGAVLVELTNTEQDASLAQAQAHLMAAKHAYDRYKALDAKGFATKADIDQYEAAYLSAQSDVAVARARQADRTIRAPFAGVVGISDIAPGALVNPGAPIVTLDDLSSVRVDFQVPERYLAQIREGQPLTASVDAYPGDRIQGKIAKLDTRIDERTRAITARAEFPNPQRRLKPGMMVRIGISQGQHDRLALPESAIAVEGDAAFVYVLKTVGGRAIAEQRPVLVGVRQDGYAEIREGLQPGEEVVADGLNKIQPGQAIQPLAPGPGPGGGAAGARPGA